MFFFVLNTIYFNRGDILNQTYTVKAGDTLYGISNQFGVSATELARINNVNANTLRIGQILKIPVNQGTNPDNLFNYIVKKGDSLYSIARIYETTVQKLIDLNNLKSNILSIGQVLRIPETYTKENEMVMPQYINYRVKRGDSLYSIARQFNTTVDQIISDNGLKTDSLSLNQNLKIRSNNEIIEECIGPDFTIPINNTNYINYTVKKGDSLYKIANTYNTSVSDITNLNNLKTNSLSIGQVLKIPQTKSSNQTYTVKSGDNLYSIARQFKTTINDIKQKNNLSSNTLKIGQILKI